MTLDLSIDLGFDHLISSHDLDGHLRLSCRVFGINAPELSTPAGKDALAYVQSIVKLGDRVTVVSHGWDKYGGRFLGTITLASGADFAQTMIAAGHAKPYSGQGPKPV